MSANAFLDYAFDAAQRSMLFWDTLRRAGNAGQAQQGGPPAPHELLLDGRGLAPGRRCVLLRIPPFGIAPAADPDLAPVLAIDPAADPATGGVDPRGALGAAQRAGHATYALVTPRGGPPAEIVACMAVMATRHAAPPLLLAEGAGGNVALRLAALHGAGAVLLAAPEADGASWNELADLYDNPEAVAPGFLAARRHRVGPPLRWPSGLAVPVCIAGSPGSLAGIGAPAGVVALCQSREAAHPGLFLAPGLLARIAALAPGLHEVVLTDGKPRLANGDLPQGRFAARLQPLSVPADAAPPSRPVPLPLALYSDMNPALRPLGLFAPILTLTRRVTAPLNEDNIFRAMERAGWQAWSAALAPWLAPALAAPDQRLQGIVRLLLLMAMSRPDPQAATDSGLLALAAALPPGLRAPPDRLRAIAAAEAALLRQDPEAALAGLSAMLPDQATRGLARAIVEQVLPSG